MEAIQSYHYGPWEEIPTSSSPSAEEETPTTPKNGILETIKGITSFASLLRVCGAMTVLAAMSAFLMQDWAAGNDINRYYMLLSQTLLLAMGGFGLSYLLKENKGARVFFGLGLVSITVNMATLGALIFSMTQWGSSLAHYPGFAKWQAVDLSAITIALMTTLAVSAPVAIFSYKVLARRSARMLTGLSLFANLLLLLPVRESVFVGALAIAAILVPLWFIRGRMQDDNTLRTPEGWFAIASIFAPAAIIIFRSLWLYPIDELLQIALAGTAFTALRFCAPQVETSSLARKISNWLSVGIALAIAVPLASLTEGFISETVAFTVFGASFAALLVDIANRSDKPNAFVILSALVLAISHIFPVIINISVASPVLCVLAGIATIALGRHYVSRTTLLIGAFTIIAGTAQQMADLVQLINFSSWITLAVTGCSIIISASLIERHGAIIKLKWEKFTHTGKE